MGALQAEFDFDRLTAGDPTIARAADPGTSHEAAVSITPEAREASERAVLEIVRDFGPLTDEQIVKALDDMPGLYADEHHWTPQRIRTARNQLVEKGLVRDAGSFGKTATGRRAIEWAVA